MEREISQYYQIILLFVQTKYLTLLPNSIYINDFLQNYKDKMVYNLENETNEIKMIWNDYLTSLNVMFSYLGNIIYIDLSNLIPQKLLL